jgi:hypothetical protein
MPATRSVRPERPSLPPSPTRRSRPDVPKPAARNVHQLCQRDVVIASLLRCPDHDSEATTARAVAL